MLDEQNGPVGFLKVRQGLVSALPCVAYQNTSFGGSVEVGLVTERVVTCFRRS